MPNAAAGRDAAERVEKIQTPLGAEASVTWKPISNGGYNQRIYPFGSELASIRLCSVSKINIKTSAIILIAKYAS